MLDGAAVLERGPELSPPLIPVEPGSDVAFTLPKLNVVEPGAAEGKPEACVDAAEPKLNPLESDGTGLAGAAEFCG